MRRLLSFSILSSFVLASTASAQIIDLEACLSGSFEAPPIPSTATGRADLTYDRSTGMLTYDVSVSGFVGTAAHIHLAPVGVPGPIEIPLAGGPTSWVGSAGPLTATQVGDMLHEQWYVNVHSGAFPGGEVRGQVRVRQFLRSHPNGPEETPPTPSAATAVGQLFINLPAGTLTYNIVATGLVGTAAHIHSGAPGVPGPIVIPLAGGPTVWSGTTAALTNTQLLDLLSGLYYVNIHTAAFPGGEIRGQIEPGGLNAASGTISLAVGGKQRLRLEAGTGFAGDLYWLLGTTTGTSPGLAAGGGIVLPLNFSNYMLFQITNPNLLPTNSLAFLDAAGESTSIWQIPAGLAAGLAGSTFHHAYLVLDVFTFNAKIASNPVPLVLVP